MANRPFESNETVRSRERHRQRADSSRGNPLQSKPRQEKGYSAAPHPKLQPGSFNKGGRPYAGKREKLKAKKNYALKVKSKFAKQLQRSVSQTSGEDAAFIQTPEFYKEIFAEVDRENVNKLPRQGVSDQLTRGSGEALEDSLETITAQSEDDEVLSSKEGCSPPDAAERSFTPTLASMDEQDAAVDARAHKKPKPNPFKKSIAELERQQKELEKIKRDAANAAKERHRATKLKRRQRKQATSKLMRRSKSGQPILSNQIGHLLSKLEKP
ncbi:hypothetical protein L0F63_003505 [Massospora cicadina]|nr:hypothetical protein L0F63_003505 [Massospora cicadina]